MESRTRRLSNLRDLVIASKNRGKIKEIQAIMAHLPVRVIPVDECGAIVEPEETGRTFAANAELKARYYAQATGKACLADDSGLEVDALDGAPGVYSARFAGSGASDTDNNQKLLALMQAVPAERRTARFRCALAFVDVDGTMLVADGTCEGVILDAPSGLGGFGYDPLFFVPELRQTLAAVSVAEKNIISHRGVALRSLVRQLEEYLSCESV